MNKKTTPKKTALVVQAPVMLEPTPPNLLSMAIEKNMGIEQLQKLIEMNEKWRKERAREAFMAALAKFQSIAPDLKKNKSVHYDHKSKPGSTDYQYQDLADITKNIRQALAECGLSFKWGQKDEGEKVSIWCTIRHAEGHEEVGEALTSTLDKSGGKEGIQAKASTITYLRRYTLTGMLGLSSADQDDDGIRVKDVPIVNGLPRMSDEQFKSTLKQVIAGTTGIDQIKEYYTLTEDQESAFVKAKKV